MKLRKAHLDQLSFYLKRMRETAEYFGNHQQFQKRHIDLEQWLFEQIDALPKKGGKP